MPIMNQQLPGSNPSAGLPPASGAGFNPSMGMPPTPDAGVPPQGGATDPSAPITPEQRAELVHKLDSVKQGYSKWQSMRFALGNKANEAKRDQLRQVFQVFQSKGINLNDPQAVKGYLEQLRQESPQNYQALSSALDYLLSNENEQSPEQQSDSGPELPGGPDLSGGDSGAADAGAGDAVQAPDGFNPGGPQA